jgi:hypothetical protein
MSGQERMLLDHAHRLASSSHMAIADKHGNPARTI